MNDFTKSLLAFIRATETGRKGDAAYEPRLGLGIGGGNGPWRPGFGQCKHSPDGDYRNQSFFGPYAYDVGVNGEGISLDVEFGEFNQAQKTNFFATAFELKIFTGQNITNALGWAGTNLANQGLMLVPDEE